MNPARPKYSRKGIVLLNGQQNGRLAPEVLVKTSARGLLMNHVSARKFDALTGAAILAGIPLTSSGDYRTFASQLNGLLTRYDVGYIPGRADYNVYEGQTYSLKPGRAQVAEPGKSQHGMARARDWAVMLKGKVLALRASDKKWLAANAHRFGIFFPVSSEDWHAEDYAGDVLDLCPGVIEYELGECGPIVPGFDPEHGLFSLYPLDDNKATLRLRTPHFKSDLVAYLQGVLSKFGIVIAIDGDYGNQTDRFVREFQNVRGLKVDGVVGSVTWAAIDKEAVK